jgi:hypothetical protein
MDFFQQVLDKCALSKFLKALKKEFKAAFLDSLLLGSLLDSSDFDGSVSYYLQIFVSFLQSTQAAILAQIWTEFALVDQGEVECVDDPKISCKDFLFTKINSLDEKVCCLTLQILSLLLQPPFSDYSLPILFGFNSQDASMEPQLETVKNLQLVRRFMSLISINELSQDDMLDVFDYFGSLSLTSKSEPVRNHAPKPLEPQDILKESEIIEFLLHKLKTRFFKNSSKVNLRLTQVISQIGALPCPRLACRLISGDAFCGSDTETLVDSLYTILSQLHVESHHLDDTKGDLFMNQMILREFTKESLAIYMMHT